MDKKSKQYTLIIAAGIVLYSFLSNAELVSHVINEATKLVLPIIVGGIIAILLNVPINGIEKGLNQLLGKSKKQLSEKTVFGLSFMFGIMGAILAVVLISVIVVPEIVKSIKEIYALIIAKSSIWIEFLISNGFDAQWLDSMISKLEINNVSGDLANSLEQILKAVFGTMSSVVEVVAVVGIGIVLSIYMLFDKKNICRQSEKIIYAYVNDSWGSKIIGFGKHFNDTFTKFLTSQCKDACILGLLMWITLSVFKVPYALMIGVLTAVCAIIPYIGAFISCCVSVLLSLVIDPLLAIKCLIIYLTVQFVEGHFIYPRVVGHSVGLSPLYTLIAALIGGKLFGLVGMVMFIPLFATIADVIRENVNNRLEEKGFNNEKNN